MCENTLITRHCLLQRKSLSGCEFDNKLLFLVRKKQFSTCLIFVAEIPVKIYRQRLFLNLFLYSYDFYSKTMEPIFASQNTARCFKQSLLLKILVLVDFEYFMGPNSKAIIRETTCTKRLHSSNCINVFCYVCFAALAVDIIILLSAFKPLMKFAKQAVNVYLFSTLSQGLKSFTRSNQHLNMTDKLLKNTCEPHSPF